MYKSNPNPNPLDLGKVAKSGFKSKSGFGFARHWKEVEQGLHYSSHPQLFQFRQQF